MNIYEENGVTILEMIRPNNFHVHLRETEQLNSLVSFSARQFGHIMAMPNLEKPLTSVVDAVNYCLAIQVAGQMWNFQSHVALYLTDKTSKEDIREAVTHELLAGKLYPSGVTTNSSDGVTDILNLYKLFAVMEEFNFPLSIHCEDPNHVIDIFDREKVFIDKYLEDIVIEFPELRIIFEHVSTKEGVQFVKNMPSNVVATITPQHMLCNRNDLLAKGICPSKFCFPVVNRKIDQDAVIAAATSGHEKFFLGTDSAPHSDSSKYCEGGKGGCFTELYAIELYAEAFERADALDDRFEAFASFNGSDFYGLPRNTAKLRMVRKEHNISHRLCIGEKSYAEVQTKHKEHTSIRVGEKMYATPFMAGEVLDWQIDSIIQ